MIPNEIIRIPEEHIVIVKVTRRDGSKHDVILDEFVYNAFKELHLYVSPTRHKRNEFYARTYINGKQYQLHRWLLGAYLDAEFPEVDHVNPFCTLDNRLSNLRPADRKLQRLNTKKNRLTQQQYDN